MKNVLGLIFNKLVWVEDRRSFKLVCKEWWCATKKIPKPIVLFRHGYTGLEWEMKMENYKKCHGILEWYETKQRIVFEKFDFEFYYMDTDENLVKYGDECQNYPVPIIIRNIDWSDELIDDRIVHNGKTFVYIGIGIICETLLRGAHKFIYTELKNVEPLNDIIIYVSRELYQKMAYLDEVNERTREFKKLKV